VFDVLARLEISAVKFWDNSEKASSDQATAQLRHGGAGPEPVPTALNSENYLWQKLDRHLSVHGVNPQRARLIGFAAAQQGPLLLAFATIDLATATSSAEINVLQNSDSWDQVDCVLINHDAFEDSLTAVETYLSFRKRFPTKTVILVSTQIRGDDFGLDRAAICDATLRFPVSSERLRSGILAAVENRRTMLSHR
jgi:hypothetical protein